MRWQLESALIYLASFRKNPACSSLPRFPRRRSRVERSNRQQPLSLFWRRFRKLTTAAVFVNELDGGELPVFGQGRQDCSEIIEVFGFVLPKLIFIGLQSQ
jgi:hypothetical protein